MCGIAGIVDPGGRFGRERLAAIAAAMRDALSHRGPDDAGVWVDPTGTCALAHRRLSVLDLSERGRQPMVTDDGQVGLTFNGEIYDHAALRARLEARGYRFRSGTDAEVLLYLFASGESGNLEQLEGMYAFATWNACRRRLFLARDAFGKKPLYIARGPGWLAFASELVSFRYVPGFDGSIDPLALSEYLLLQYVHAPRTIYASCQKLRPGHWMAIDFDGTAERVRSGRHFEFEPKGGHEGAVPYAEPDPERLEAAVDELLPLVRAAVRRRLASDVPLGAFLSGGIDSAVVVAMMRAELGRPVQTYSVGWQGSDESEHLQAREAAALLGSDHHEQLLSPHVVELLPLVAAALDEPLGDSGCLPTFLLSEFTRRGVTVALSGDGGDELFGGYGRYRDTLREEGDWKMRARWLVRHKKPWRSGRAYCGLRWLMFEPSAVADLLGAAGGAHADGLVERWAATIDEGTQPLVHRLRGIDADTYMPGAVLPKVDRMSMAFALEVRCPLLDRSVARFAAGLPAELTFAAGQTKPLLRALAARYLPAGYVARKKSGFGLPGRSWSVSEMLALCDELLLSPRGHLMGLLDPAGLRRFVDHQRQPGCFSIYQVWTLLLLECWLEAHRLPAGIAVARPAAVPAEEVAV